MASRISNLLAIIAPKKGGKKGGVAATSTFNPQQTDQVLTVPRYREHLTDIFNSRQANDSRELLRELFKHDPDISAAVFSYLTMANTKPLIVCKSFNGAIDREATVQLHQIIKRMTAPVDYTKGFQLKKSFKNWCEELRYMALLRGGLGLEVVLDEKLQPSDFRNVDLASVEWYERRPGEYKPVQKLSGTNTEINLDIPSFFVSFFRRDPTSIYPYSPFVASINTIAARQQVINDLYRIMQKTGFPRMTVKVIEEVLRRNMPVNLRTDEAGARQWLNQRLAEIQTNFTTLQPHQAVIHWDSVEPGMMNERQPGASLDVTSVIETLNAQNQAALKTMATVIGRGSGAQVSSVEARIASMNADELNEPVSDVLSNALSFVMHQIGFQGFVEVDFKLSELRPELELEPQLTLRASRLRQDLSDGLITDDEYHLMMYNRLRPDNVEEKMGTGFMRKGGIEVDAKKVTPNADPLGRSLSPEGSRAAESDAVK